MSQSWQTLISAEELAALLDFSQPAVVFDCRHTLTQPEAGRLAWQQAHIPGAFYSHLDTDQALLASRGGIPCLPGLI